MADFSELEAREGVRLSWNVWPNTKLEATKCVLPFAALVTPCKKLQDCPVVPYQPVPCRSCGSVLNPFARVDFPGKLWVCPFCYTRNQFPPHYNAISESNLPAELFPNYSAIDYTIPKPGGPQPPAYIFVVDTCVSDDELNTCKGALLQALGLLPENALVGLLTYGTHVQVHEIGFSACAKSWVFQGSKEVDPRKVAHQLGLHQGQHGRQMGHQGQGAPPAPGLGRFLLPLSEGEFVLSELLENLTVDSFRTPVDKRASRCTGTALQVATALAGACLTPGGSATRIMLFVGGPATEGQGSVVQREKTEAIRSHKDLVKDQAPYFQKATQFYESLAHQLVLQGHTLDVFACALDQVGLAEMKPAVERTGGMVALAESYHHQTFKDSLRQIFLRGEAAGGGGDAAGKDGGAAKDEGLNICSHGTVEVFCSKDIKVAGCVGPCAPLDKKSPLVSENQVGMGGTTVWRLCSLSQSTTLCVYFDIVGSKEGPNQQPQGGMMGQSQQFFLQFQVKYTTLEGEGRMRVITLTRHWTDGGNVQDLLAGFDQEASAVIMARLLSSKMESEEEFNATRWLDRALIRLCSRFGDYRTEDPTSFQLSPQMSIYPQFMFNLRRSQFVQVFNNSPDETAYFRMVLCCEDAFNSLVMIQPTLTSYSFNGPPEPALLDVASIAADRILLLDAFFQVVVFHGSTIAQWRKAKYHERPEHAAFAQLLTTPMEDAKEIIKGRFPVPRLVDCDQHGSQARFLLAKLNPSSTYNSSMQGSGSEVIMTDDVSLQVFMDHLRKLAVQPS
uniref:Protein transport protein SEC23 n=1 Tax=Chloropicon laureae TaxID=464258 RepID=A0A7S3E547_9CHLO|mmetsp:Transcript_8669/g.22199  ORF Transcript_8669/g.22199 Transcript_8669/m.22199 type:complete len:786 (+) Transcript_8669:72-2429(+)